MAMNLSELKMKLVTAMKAGDKPSVAAYRAVINRVEVEKKAKPQVQKSDTVLDEAISRAFDRGERLLVKNAIVKEVGIYTEYVKTSPEQEPVLEVLRSIAPRKLDQSEMDQIIQEARAFLPGATPISIFKEAKDIFLDKYPDRDVDLALLKKRVDETS